MDRKRRPYAFRHRRRQSRIEDGGKFHPEARRWAHLKLAILEAFHEELLRAKGTRLKREAEAEFFGLYNAGLILPETFPRPKAISRSTLYNWIRAYKDFGFLGLIPKWKWKPKSGAAVIPIKLPSRLEKIVIPGPLKRISKYEFLPQLSRKWNGPPLTCPIHLSIFYSMAVPKGTSMRRRMKMLKGQLSHAGKPDLDSLNAFLIDCMEGICFRFHSQIQKFYSEKSYRWWPQTRIFIRALSG